jgi:asparagine synthase (glutamine-hydrolysing)
VCGICGVIQIEGDPRPVISVEALERMTDVMEHRGPDDRGTYSSDGIAIGVRRLSIVDVEGGHQPFCNEDESVWAAQNGELYNHADLREELRRVGHRFASRCDTEVLPHLYEVDGADLATRLRGKFAFVVWDSKKRRAVLARDRLGVKPLYYAQSRGLLIFASELKALLASGLISPSLDYDAIACYLGLGYFAGPSTPLLGVKKLMPGHRLVVENRSVRSESYWRLPFPSGTAGKERDEREYAERLVNELEESVRLRLMSDVPLGAMLSGGLDSSVVVALMARNTGSPVKTFSVAFAEDAEGNELDDARLVASAFGTDHHELVLSLRDEAISLEDLVWCLDEPLADLSALGLHALSKLASEHVTVALSGQGADELLGGYPPHRNAALAGLWERAPGVLQPLGPPLARRVPRRYRRAAAAIVSPDPVTRFLRQSSKLSDDLRRTLLRGPLAGSTDVLERELAARSLGSNDGDPLSATLYLHQQLGLVDDMLQYFDRASMANSLEVRVPFLDHHVVEYCATVPNRFKANGMTRKRLLRVAARDLIPDRIIEKRKVGFFNHAVGQWFDDQAERAIGRYLLHPNPSFGEFLDPGEVARLVENHRSSRNWASSGLLLSILMLEVWLRTFLPRALGESRSGRPTAGRPT